MYHEFLRRPSGPPSLIPAKGDVLRLKKAFPLYITGYGQTGEVRRLESWPIAFSLLGLGVVLLMHVWNVWGKWK